MKVIYNEYKNILKRVNITQNTLPMCNIKNYFKSMEKMEPFELKIPNKI